MRAADTESRSSLHRFASQPGTEVSALGAGWARCGGSLVSSHIVYLALLNNLAHLTVHRSIHRGVLWAAVCNTAARCAYEQAVGCVVSRLNRNLRQLLHSRTAHGRLDRSLLVRADGTAIVAREQRLVAGTRIAAAKLRGGACSSIQAALSFQVHLGAVLEVPWVRFH